LRLNYPYVKKFYIACLFLLPVSVLAQPAGYYNSAWGKNGEALRIALYNIIKGHTALSYTPGLWNAYYTTDVKPNGKLATIYSDKPGGTPPYEFTLGTSQCSGSTPATEGVCYNREHIWPQSKFGSAAPMYTDLWVVYPTDSKVNSQRADWPYGKVILASWTSQNGSKLGPNTYPGAPSTTAFEPIDSFKGDIARSYFYITTRYYGDSAAFSDWEMAAKSTLKPWVIQMLLEWHHLDPVSAKEKARNEAAYAQQNNRNPFIDEPRFADCIWAGNCAGLDVANVNSSLFRLYMAPNPARSTVKIDWESLAPNEVLAMDIINVQGALMLHVAPGGNSLSVDVHAWPGGFYMLKVKTQHGVRTEKLLVE
jgi:endonuclease I